MVLRLLLPALALAGCGGPIGTFAPVPEGELAQSGVVIEDDAQAFRIVGGRIFPTPFTTYDCPAAPTTRNWSLGLRLGARRVRVRHPAASAPLYGVLAFCPVSTEASGPVRRGYRLEIPDRYVHETEGGRVSVVFEPSGYSKPYFDGTHNLPAWILWLSRRPL